MAVSRARISSARRAHWGWIVDRCPGSITPASTALFLTARVSSQTSSAASVTESRTQYFRAIRDSPSRKPAISRRDGELTMSMSEIENVLTVLRDIGSGNPDLATGHMNPAKYIEHNPGLLRESGPSQ